MGTQILPPIDVSHPAPHRSRVRLAALLFGFALAPAAWSFQLLFSVALSGHGCYPRTRLLAAPLWSGLWAVLLAISVVGILAAFTGGMVARKVWKNTYNERPGSGHELLDRGEGRTRFMAMCGMLISALFLIALTFGVLGLFLVPLCGQ